MGLSHPLLDPSSIDRLTNDIYVPQWKQAVYAQGTVSLSMGPEVDASKSGCLSTTYKFVAIARYPRWYQPSSEIMEISEVYAITAGALFGLLLVIRATSFFLRFSRPYGILLVKHLLYPRVLRRHRFVGPWTRAQVLAYIVYLAVNIICSTLRVSTVGELGTRTGTLSLINMIPTYFGYHLSFVSDILGLSILDYRRIHAWTGVMSVSLGLLHSVVSVAGIADLDLFSASGQLFGLIVNM